MQDQERLKVFSASFISSILVPGNLLIDPFFKKLVSFTKELYILLTLNEMASI